MTANSERPRRLATSGVNRPRRNPAALRGPSRARIHCVNRMMSPIPASRTPHRGAQTLWADGIRDGDRKQWAPLNHARHSFPPFIWTL
jgi:hypothetical protein